MRVPPYKPGSAATFEPGLGFVAGAFGLAWLGFVADFDAGAKTAVTAVGDEIVNEHAPLPLQPPAQRASRKPFLSFRTRITRVPETKLAVHLPGHEIPAGVLVTVAPLPSTTIVSGARPARCETAAPGRISAVAATPGRIASRGPRTVLETRRVIGLTPFIV